VKKYAPLLLVAIVAFFAGTWFGSRREYGKPEASAAEVPRGASEV